jgi:Ras-related protein Rab-5C
MSSHLQTGIIMSTRLEIRVVLIGDPAVGKTSILNRFINGQFDPEEHGTVGVGYFSAAQTISGKSTVIEIWDTAGQEKSRSLSPLYYRRAAGALVVFDVTNPQSCEHLTEWISAFKGTAGDETVIAISGNKVDLSSAGDEAMRKAELLALNSNYIFESTSAYTGQGVRQLFERFLCAIVEGISSREGTPDQSVFSIEMSRRCPC